MSKPDPAAVPARRELETGERVDRYRVGVDAADVAKDDVSPAPFQYRADPGAKSGQVGSGDRAADGEGDRLRPTGGHQQIDRQTRENSSAPVTDEFRNAVRSKP
jgi:hypothetical protein